MIQSHDFMMMPIDEIEKKYAEVKENIKDEKKLKEIDECIKKLKDNKENPKDYTAVIDAYNKYCGTSNEENRNELADQVATAYTKMNLSDPDKANELWKSAEKKLPPETFQEIKKITDEQNKKIEEADADPVKNSYVETCKLLASVLEMYTTDDLQNWADLEDKSNAPEVEQVDFKEKNNILNDLKNIVNSFDKTKIGNYYHALADFIEKVGTSTGKDGWRLIKTMFGEDNLNKLHAALEKLNPEKKPEVEAYQNYLNELKKLSAEIEKKATAAKEVYDDNEGNAIQNFKIESDELKKLKGLYGEVKMMRESVSNLRSPS